MLGIFLFTLTTFTGCVGTYNDYWGDRPPADWTTFFDQRLNGYWALVNYNSDPVHPSDANYLFFNGNGWGQYYYQQNGFRKSEQTHYWCRKYSYGSAEYQINMQYRYAPTETMSYWFTRNGNTLVMQWTTNYGTIETYYYDRIYGAPW